VIEFILTLIMSFGLGRMSAQRPPQPPRECRVVGWTNTIPPHVITEPPGCVPAPRTAR